jgi:putative heme iron utilization protein
MIEELASVVLTTDMPERGLQAGDIGTVVLVHQHGQGYTVEFMTLSGETIAVVTLAADEVRLIRPNEIAHVRELVATS